jgi:hypothetical protein
MAEWSSVFEIKNVSGLAGSIGVVVGGGAALKKQ